MAVGDVGQATKQNNMEENELIQSDDAADESTLTEENIQEEDLESEPDPGNDTVEIGGVEYTREELAELVSKGKDYTQKRQTEAEELRALKAQVEQLANQGEQPVDMSPEDWLEQEAGYVTEEGRVLANALNVLLSEINSLKTQMTPVIETQKLSAAEQSVSAMLKPHGVQASSDQIRAALKMAGGDEAKAALSIALAGAKPQGSPKRTPPASQTPGNPAKIRDMDVSKMTDAQLAEWRRDIMNSVS